ncbi:MAG: hypothetical protein COV08_01080 [Candidatus Vogelbacteria bacterium CG10_big_fil_rev_8_21_14_0_10_49_38]|uniref:Uncharacterized protein n=1 Tax=Candidatus Vogelbacteria bacterium CG10_big_fil_rev_8_21_14_0_10_49_38 TaxID=1975043 RepID=A0A2H0RIB7_9BACT|nr:MAG: hypothetical protein BK006_01090 [bacterium CG10_49_38]PIR46197.1 MAG: hypothetical protein COV08_01080 [Candidatus Vogelbacteria bacterium CG10_big_fil_rev_8_21_14_0_10_49_38]
MTLFNFLSEFLKPRQLPETLRTEHQKQNFLFHLREILPRAKSENVKKIFCFWCPPSPRGGWRGVQSFILS